MIKDPYGNMVPDTDEEMQEMLAKHKTEGAGKVNAYVCNSCKMMMVTVNVDSGTTPFMITCRFCPKGEARSHFYRVPQIPEMAQMEWHRPKRADVSEDSLQHWRNGGLFLRMRCGGEA